MKITVVDGYCLNPGDLSWEFLADLGEYRIYHQTDYNQIIERCRDADIVVTNKAFFDEKIISSLPKLKFITVTATGYNIVDISAAQKHQVMVANVPDYSTKSVAQAVFALLLELVNQVGHHSQTVLKGRWCQVENFSYWDRPLIELAGKKLGIIGYGRIGRQVAEIAEAFGMDVLVYQHKKNMHIEKFELVSLEDLLKTSDVVSLNCPLTETNRELINKEKIGLMKQSAFLINTARGQLVNENDLAAALNSGRIAGAGLDVLSQEPPNWDNPLLKANNCFITPHNAWASKEARTRMMEYTAENIKAFISGKPQNIVS